jgi:hypothetical protein
MKKENEDLSQDLSRLSAEEDEAHMWPTPSTLGCPTTMCAGGWETMDDRRGGVQ